MWENLTTKEKADLLDKMVAVAELRREKKLDQDDGVLVPMKELRKLLKIGKPTEKRLGFTKMAALPNSNFSSRAYDNPLRIIIFDVSNRAAKEYYDLVSRRNEETNEVKLPLEGMSKGKVRDYNAKIRELVKNNLIVRVKRGIVMINPYHIFATAFETSCARWDVLNERDNQTLEEVLSDREPERVCQTSDEECGATDSCN